MLSEHSVLLVAVLHRSLSPVVLIGVWQCVSRVVVVDLFYISMVQANSIESHEVKAASWLHRFIIGRQGSNVRRITADFPRVSRRTFHHRSQDVLSVQWTHFLPSLTRCIVVTCLCCEEMCPGTS